MTLPNLSRWHEVPEGGVIPAWTPYVVRETPNHFEHKVSSLSLVVKAYYRKVYYTEEPVLTLEEEETEQRAREMYYSMGGTFWESEDDFKRDKWRSLAEKYIEKDEDEG